jgi:hypothetical protein
MSWAWPVALLVAVVAARADDPKPQGGPPKKAEAAQSPAERYKALDKEFNDAQQEFFKVYQEAKTDEEKQKLLDEKYPRPDRYAARFLKLAEEHPNDPAAVDALVWVGTRSNPADRQKALDTLLKDHIQSDKLGTVCQTLSYAADGETPLRAILEKSPHHAVQGTAGFNLAQLLKRRADRGGANDPATVKEAEGLFERVVEKYADVKHFRGTLADAARGELFEMRNLAVGKVVPEIEGEDIDGVKFKLSDYRGKVVLIDFWGHW